MNRLGSFVVASRERAALVRPSQRQLAAALEAATEQDLENMKSGQGGHISRLCSNIISMLRG